MWLKFLGIKLKLKNFRYMCTGSQSMILLKNDYTDVCSHLYNIYLLPLLVFLETFELATGDDTRIASSKSLYPSLGLWYVPPNLLFRHDWWTDNMATLVLFDHPYQVLLEYHWASFSSRYRVPIFFCMASLNHSCTHFRH